VEEVAIEACYHDVDYDEVCLVGLQMLSKQGHGCGMPMFLVTGAGTLE
jgi:hypothetical protein